MTECLRIAQVAPVAGPVGPDSEGSIEQIVYLLTEELVRRGHRVTLFATGDSRTSASLHATYERDYESDRRLWDWRFHETMHVAAAFERAGDFDVIHSHDYHHALPFCRLVETAVVHTYHVTPWRDVVLGFARCPRAHLVAVSRHQRRSLRPMRDVPVVHHGLDIDRFPFNARPNDHLVFLGRLIPRKGVVEAIEVARRSGLRLIVAGPADDPRYFRELVRPALRRGRAEYVGRVDASQRNELLAGAAALLYPITACEPFGLVLVEAMACGTPVAALRRGAVPEIVSNGVTGFHAKSLERLVESIPFVLGLDRGRVRRVAAKRFHYRRMVDDYLGVYRRVAARAEALPG